MTVHWQNCESEADWLELRKQGVGASEAAAVVGLSPWATPLEIYFRKRDEVPPLDAPRLKWGKKLEPLVAQEYTEQTGWALEKPPGMVCWLEESPWMIASLDYWLPDEDGQSKPVEIKTVSQWNDWGEPGTDEVPHHYKLQVQQQMECSGTHNADIAALCLNTWKLRIYHVARNQELIDHLRDSEALFMARVASGDPPLPDFMHPTTVELLNMLEPMPASVVPLGEEDQDMADDYQALGERIKALQAQRDEAKGRLIFAMGTAEEGDLPDGRTVRRKMVNVRGYTVDPNSYIKFSIQNPKKRR